MKKNNDKKKKYLNNFYVNNSSKKYFNNSSQEFSQIKEYSTYLTEEIYNLRQTNTHINTNNNEIGSNIELINIGVYSAKIFKEYLKNNSLQSDSTIKGTVTYVSSGNEDTFKEKVKLVIN